MEDKSEASAAILNAMLEEDEEKVWERQRRLREVRREGDKLSAAQEEDLRRVLEASKADRLLCQAARAAGIIDESPEGSLKQAELAEAIRQQAAYAGIPYKGLTTEELMQVVKQEAELRRGVLVDQVNHILRVLNAAEREIGSIRLCKAELEGVYDGAQRRIREAVSRLVSLAQDRERELLQCLDNARHSKLQQLQKAKQDTVSIQDKLQTALLSANALKTGNDLKFLTGYSDMQNMLDDVLQEGTKWSDGLESMPTLDIPITFQPYAAEAVLSYGRVGDMLEDQSNCRVINGLQWDGATCSEVLQVSSDGRTLLHMGKHDERAMGMTVQGFSSGIAVVRIKLSGLDTSQWVAVGVTSPSKLNTASMISDAMIFAVDNTLQTRLVYNLGAEGVGKSRDDLCIADKDLITITVDTDTGTAEYWREGVQVKRNRIVTQPTCNPKTDSSHEEEEKACAQPATKLHVFCILFHPGQEARLI